MLRMQAYKDYGGTGKQADNRPGTAGNADRVKLLICYRFYHAVQFLKIQAWMVPQLRQVQRLQQL